MRRSALPFEPEQRPPPFHLAMPPATEQESNPGHSAAGGGQEDGTSAGRAKAGPRPEAGRSSQKPRKSPAATGPPSKAGALCGLLYSLLCFVVSTFWGLCTAWILVVILVYVVYGTGLMLALVFLAILGLAYNIQDSLLYFPTEPESSRFYVAPPHSTGLPHESLYLQAADRTRIHAVLFKQEEPLFGRAPTVLFFHGNAGNIAHRYFNAHGLFAMCGCNILFLEYRGYGRSEGRPSEAGFYLDAQAGLDYLHSRGDIDQRRIVLFGRSLGGAVAVHLAAQAPNRGKIAGLLVENTFTSIPDMGAVIFRLELLRWVPLFLVKNKYFSIKKVKSIRSPTLFISGVEDELVPAKMMHALFQRCGSRKKQLIRFEGGTHNETWHCHGYFTIIREFLTQATYRETQLIKDLPAGAQCAGAAPGLSPGHHADTV